MKFLFLLLIYNLVVAQPILTASDINFSSLSYNVYNSSGLTLPPVSPSGPDQIWNYSDLTLDLFSTSVSTIVNTAPFSNNFPNANFFIKTSKENNDTYGIYNLSSSKLERLGSTNNLGPIVTYNNPSTVFIFPCEYGVSNTDTSSQVGGSTFTNTKAYEAYGTLTTALGTNTNVLRIKTIDGQRTTYNWLALNPLRDIMAVSIFDNQILSYFIFEYTNLNTSNNLVNTNFKLYPNPTSDFISIEKSNYTPESFISVYDLLGNEIIKKHSFSETIDKINVSNFSAGMYFVSIKNAENKIIHYTKFIKK